MTVYSAGKRNLEALRVDSMFTVESLRVNCDAMTNGACFELMWMKSQIIEIVDILSLKFASDEAAG